MKKRLLSALIRALLGASCALAEEADPKEFECLGYHLPCVKMKRWR